jgi:hypothetical protein
MSFLLGNRREQYKEQAHNELLQAFDYDDVKMGCWNHINLLQRQDAQGDAASDS